MVRKLSHIYAVDEDMELDIDIESMMTDEQKGKMAEYAGKLDFHGDAQDITGRILLYSDAKINYFDHSMYMLFNSINAGTTYDGARLNAEWYERNLKIFANIQKLCETAERLLVVYGFGHMSILRHLVRSCDNMKLVEAAEYIKPRKTGLLQNSKGKRQRAASSLPFYGK